MKNIMSAGLVALLCASCVSSTQNEVNQFSQNGQMKCMEGLNIDNLIYAIKGEDTLTVDIFTDKLAQPGEKRPLLLYVFGGGFESGNRQAGSSDVFNFVPYFAKELGYVSAAIDYRLGFAKARKEGRVPSDLPAANMFDPMFSSSDTIINEFLKANKMAIEDLMDATTFILSIADKYGIDQEKIMVAGSSAGALTLLGAEYMICNGDETAKTHLPEGFRYSCLVAMAGGIWTKGNEKLHFDTPPCPILLFHGDADELVPYTSHTLSQTNKLTLHGARDIADVLREQQMPYCLYTVEGGNHLISGIPMIFNREDIDAFFKRTVCQGQRISMELVEKSLTTPHDYQWFATEYIAPLLAERPDLATVLLGENAGAGQAN